MGWQSVQQATKVGAMLIELKADPASSGTFVRRASQALKAENEVAGRQMASVLMRLAAHLPLLEKHKPESQAQALGITA